MNHEESQPKQVIPESKTAYVRISRQATHLTLRGVSYPGGEVSFSRTASLSETLAILEELRPEILVFDSHTLTSEPLEIISALHRRKIYLRVGCTVQKTQSVHRFGNAIWCTSQESLSADSPPVGWEAQFTVGDYLDLALLHRCSARFTFDTETQQSAKITLYLGKIREEDKEIATRLSEEVPSSMAFHTILSTSQTETQPTNNNKEEYLVALDLKTLSEVDGFIASCLVDSESGMVLGAHGGNAQFNIEVAAAGNAEVLKAKRRTMKALSLTDSIEDILVTLSSQYHLFRPLGQNPAYFLYLALDRSKANLAMARHALKEFDATVKLK